MAQKLDLKNLIGSPEHLAYSPFVWALMNQVKLAHGVFQLKGHWFLQEYMDDDSQITYLTKGTQLGFTEGEILRVCHGGVYKKFKQGVLYLFPSLDIAQDFSASRFRPLVSYNPKLIGQYIKEVQKVDLVKINGMDVYFRSASGTQKTASGETDVKSVKNIPVDRIIFDEFDEMNPDVVAAAKDRLGHSEVKQESYLANPTVPGYGIDALFMDSDQMYWEILCKACGKYTNMELEFPNSLKRIAPDKVIRACIHCGKQIHPRHGKWIAQYPQKKKRGRRISQLVSIYNDPTAIMERYEDPKTDIAMFHRHVLGMAYIEAENKLTQENVFQCCGPDANGYTKFPHPPMAMGVDVNSNVLHTVIGYPIPGKKSYKIVYVGRLGRFSDVHDKARKYMVKSAVVDREPETRKAREFQAGEDYTVFLSDYQERLKTEKKEDEEAGVITVRRSEILDRSHNVVTDAGSLEIPRKDKEIKEFAFEMSNEAKIIEEDPKTGYRKPTYRKVGPNDYRHAVNFFLLACDNVAYQAEVSRRRAGTSGDRQADIKRNKNYNPLKNVLGEKAA